VASITLIDESRAVAADAVVDGETIRLAPAEIARTLGWELKPQGLCRGDICIPVRDRLVQANGVDLAELARLLGRPLASEPAEGIAVLGAAASERADLLHALDAPDFALPDLAGRLHHLRDQRGKKTLLIAWASW
jgi:hypothetical protein